MNKSFFYIVIAIITITTQMACVSETIHEEREKQIAWPSAKLLDKSLLAQIKPEIKADLKKVGIPILIVKGIDTKSLVLDRDFYTFNIEQNNLIIHLLASRRSMLTGSIIGTHGANEKIRTGVGFYAQSTLNQSATWQEFGASYYMEVRCQSTKDTRCTDLKTIRYYVSRLGLLGGQAY
jgi:hypothetical protein